MSKKVKPSTPTVTTAKYKVGARVHVISYHKDLPENLIEGKVAGITTEEYIVGHASSTEVRHSYQIQTSEWPIINEPEEKVYGSFVVAAQVFAKAFLKLLK